MDSGSLSLLRLKCHLAHGFYTSLYFSFAGPGGRTVAHPLYTEAHFCFSPGVFASYPHIFSILLRIKHLPNYIGDTGIRQSLNKELNLPALCHFRSL